MRDAAPASPATALSALLALANKPGWKTSELYVALAIAAALQWAGAHGHGSADFNNLLTALSGGVYLWLRTNHKADMVGRLAAAAQQEVPGIRNAQDIESAVAKALPVLLPLGLTALNPAHPEGGK